MLSLGGIVIPKFFRKIDNFLHEMYFFDLSIGWKIWKKKNLSIMEDISKILYLIFSYEIVRLILA